MLVLGEAETRVVELLADHRNRAQLPAVMWLDPIMKTPVTGGMPGMGHHLAPPVDELPFVDRRYLCQDPHFESARWEANMVGARGCPYNCSFCGAAVSANPDITIRTRRPDNIIAEMCELRDRRDVTAFRFVDDLFLGARRVMSEGSDVTPVRWLLDNPVDIADVAAQLDSRPDEQRVVRHPSGTVLIFDRPRSLVTLLKPEEWEQIHTPSTARVMS